MGRSLIDKKQGKRRAQGPSGAWVGAGLSVVFHAVLLLFLTRLPAPRTYAAATPVQWQDLPSATTEPLHHGGVPNDESAIPVAGGHATTENVDTAGRNARGGESGPQEVTFLISRAHPVSLQDAPANSRQARQAQRIRTRRARRSWENRRATPHPGDSPFLASGMGTLRQRRTVAQTNPAAGAERANEASTAGDDEGGRQVGADPALATGEHIPEQPGEQGRRTASTRLGNLVPSPATGLVSAHGRRRDTSAAVEHARPPIDEGPAATLAEQQGRVADDRDAELLAAQLLQNTVDASRRSGEGERGEGGAGGGETQGTGVGGTGSHASTFTPGSGTGGLDTSSRRYRRWYIAARRRVEDRLVFPRARMLAMDQGLAVFRLRVRRDGTLATAPQRVRSSGFADLDANARAAILESTPFAAIPDDLAPGVRVLRVDMTVEFSNPMVQ